MGSLVIIAVIVVLVAGVVWNHSTKAAAVDGVEFDTPESASVIADAIRVAYCAGGKAKVKALVSGITVKATGPTSFRFQTRLDDIGEIVVSADGRGSRVRAATTELYLGSHPRTHVRSGFMALPSGIVHRTAQLLGIAPYAAKMKRFQRGLEARIARQLGRSLEPPGDPLGPAREKANDVDGIAAPSVEMSAPLAPSQSVTRTPGWYADPEGRFDHRYWDGEGWTSHVARGGHVQVDQLPQSSAAAGGTAAVRSGNVTAPAGRDSSRLDDGHVMRSELAGSGTDASRASTPRATRRKGQTFACPICSVSVEKSNASKWAHWESHIRQIPAGQGEASGQYTWNCVCGPSGMKWPKIDGAAAAMALHMFERHYISL